MPVLLVSRERVAVTADRAVVNENLALFVGLRINQPYATALRRVGVIHGQYLRYHERRRALRQALQNGERLREPEQITDQNAHSLPAESRRRPCEALRRIAAKIEIYRLPRRRAVGARADRRDIGAGEPGVV